MIDYRALQRALFRLQLDPDGVGLGAVPAGLTEAGAAGIRADLGGRRRAQVLGNLSSEFTLTLVEAHVRGLASEFPGDFFKSAHFHQAIEREESLPLAYGAWLDEQTRRAKGAEAPAALLTLEFAMARARRAPRVAAAPRPGEVALGPRAWLVDLPAGTFERAQELRGALDAGRPAPPPREAGGRAEAAERVLLVVEEGRFRHSLREVAPERLEPAAAELLRALLRPHDAAALASLIESRGWDAADVLGFVESLVADGVIHRG